MVFKHTMVCGGLLERCEDLGNMNFVFTVIYKVFISPLDNIYTKFILL